MKDSSRPVARVLRHANPIKEQEQQQQLWHQIGIAGVQQDQKRQHDALGVVAGPLMTVQKEQQQQQQAVGAVAGAVMTVQQRQHDDRRQWSAWQVFITARMKPLKI
jgi:hypothetical protein